MAVAYSNLLLYSRNWRGTPKNKPVPILLESECIYHPQTAPCFCDIGFAIFIPSLVLPLKWRMPSGVDTCASPSLLNILRWSTSRIIWVFKCRFHLQICSNITQKPSKHENLVWSLIIGMQNVCRSLRLRFVEKNLNRFQKVYLNVQAHVWHPCFL
jgi:hypothetical protein